MFSTSGTPLGRSGARMPEFRVVTTFGRAQWEAYAHALLPESLRLWGSTAEWQVWLDDNVQLGALPLGPDYRYLSTDPEHQAFMARWERMLRGPNGEQLQPRSYLHDAGRFAHKVFALTNSAAREGCETLLFLGADVEALAAVDVPWLRRVVNGYPITHLGRTDIASSETDFLAFHGRITARDFLQQLRAVYTSGDLFAYPEWIDGYVIARLAAQFGVVAQNLSAGLPGLDVFERTVLGERLRHWKGPRGKSALAARLANSVAQP